MSRRAPGTDPHQPHWFVLQALDPVTGRAVLELRFAAEDVAALREVLGGSAKDDPGPSRSHHLDPGDVGAITSAFGVAVDPGERDVPLDPWHSMRKVLYPVRKGFEIALMLEGRKPLATFSSTDPCEWLDESMRRFDPFAGDGRLARREMVSPMPTPWRAPDGAVVDRERQIYVAPRGEEWRNDWRTEHRRRVSGEVEAKLANKG